jgi:acyl-CoA thioesterase FadM
MARIKIDLPEQFSFSTIIPVRITDINYGGHVGNDTVLSLIHEARVQFLQQLGYGELDLAGVGLIMSDVGIEFKQELFYGQSIKASVTASDFTKISFDLYYKLETETAGKTVLVATAKTGMICYDYSKKKIAAIPDEVKEKLQS